MRDLYTHIFQGWFTYTEAIGSSDNGSPNYWPTRSLHTLGAGAHFQQRNCLFMWIKILCIEYMLWRILTTKSVWCCKYAKNITVKYMPMNNHELLNTHACSFHVFWNMGCTQSLLFSCNRIVPLISTRFSGHSQVILMFGCSNGFEGTMKYHIPPSAAYTCICVSESGQHYLR